MRRERAHALHGRDQDSLDPACGVLVLYQYYPVFNPGLGSAGIPPSSFEPGICFHRHGGRLSLERRVYHPMGACQIFARITTGASILLNLLLVLVLRC